MKQFIGLFMSMLLMTNTFAQTAPSSKTNKVITPEQNRPLNPNEGWRSHHPRLDSCLHSNLQKAWEKKYNRDQFLSKTAAIGGSTGAAIGGILLFGSAGLAAALFIGGLYLSSKIENSKKHISTNSKPYRAFNLLSSPYYFHGDDLSQMLKNEAGVSDYSNPLFKAYNKQGSTKQDRKMYTKIFNKIRKKVSVDLGEFMGEDEFHELVYNIVKEANFKNEFCKLKDGTEDGRYSDDYKYYEMASYKEIRDEIIRRAVEKIESMRGSDATTASVDDSDRSLGESEQSELASVYSDEDGAMEEAQARSM